MARGYELMKTKSKGQALTEFALILPILLLLILGIIEGARIIWAFVTVQNAAREAARYAVTAGPGAAATGSSPDRERFQEHRKPPLQDFRIGES